MHTHPGSFVAVATLRRSPVRLAPSLRPRR